MGQSIKPWIGLAALVAIIIGAAGWFLLISPTQAATADTRASIESESNRTITLTQALDTLKSQFADIDVSKAALEELSIQVPSKADSAAYRRVLEERAATSGVRIVTLSTGVSTPVTPPAAPADSTSTSDEGTATPSPSPSPAAEAPATGTTAVQTASGQLLVGIPIEMIVVGTYDQARAFIASLQGTEGRLFLVSGLNLMVQPDAPENAGRPATAIGDVELAIQGYLLVLTPGPNDTAGAGTDTSTDVSPTPSPSPSPTPSPSPSPTPLPSTERNPFAPLAPTVPVG